MRTIFENLLTLLERGEDAVLATVASAQGSTPRGAGSQ
ncbi:XdhC family protein, partial [Oscillibacter sp.]